MGHVSRFAELPLDQLVIDRFQARKQNAGDNLDELAASIEKWGLLQPIVVCISSRDPSKWEIVSGQRRYLAHKKILKRDTIQAGIIDSQLSLEDGLALSASENVVRLDMTRKDLIDLCGELYKRYGTIKDVVAGTGLPYQIVRKYIRFDGLTDDLKDDVNKKLLNVELAMKIQDAATTRGTYNPAVAAQLKEVLRTVDDPIQRKVLDLQKKHPEIAIEQLVERAERPDNSLKLNLILGEALAAPLRSYAQDEETDEKSAVLSFIEDALGRHGYIEE
jgi:ParB family chromosome partitioning protein